MHTNFNYDICRIEAEEAKKAEKAAANAALPRLNLKPGDHVVHAKYGEGTVGNVDDENDRLTIEFYNGEIKKFQNTLVTKLGCLTVCR